MQIYQKSERLSDSALVLFLFNLNKSLLPYREGKKEEVKRTH